MVGEVQKARHLQVVKSKKQEKRVANSDSFFVLYFWSVANRVKRIGREGKRIEREERRVALWCE